MKRPVLLAIMALSGLIFAGLVIYGWTYRYGAPKVTEPEQFQRLRVPYVGRQLELASDAVTAAVWQELPRLEVPLMHQITEKPWPRGLTPAVRVQAYHDGEDIYFLLEWDDDRPDQTVTIEAFADACAVLLPMKPDAPAQSIMMGFSSLSNIWHWRADADAEHWQGAKPAAEAYADHYNPFEQKEVHSISVRKIPSAVEDLLAERPGSLTSKEHQIVQGRGVWQNGLWRVVFRRSLATADQEGDAQIPSGETPAAFAVWDGDQGDRGSRKSIGDWVILEIEPAPAARGSAASQFRQNRYGYFPSGSALGLGALMLLPAAEVQSSEAPASGKEPVVIDIKAKRFEFTPSNVTVQKGDLVTIRLESLDVTHGLYLDGYGIQLKVRPGMADKATFLADKAGRFSFRCSETCGEFHPYMIGYLSVEPNTRFHVYLVGILAAFGGVSALVLFVARKPKGTPLVCPPKTDPGVRRVSVVG